MPEKLRIYVTGPIKGTTDFVERFRQGELEVARRGHEPVNPLHNGYMDLGSDDVAANYIAYLKRDIRTLLECDGVYMLRDWHQSRGARIEHFIADALEMLVLFQPEVMR